MSNYKVQIEDLAFGGDGVGSIQAPGDELDGIRCFVPFSVPGDILEVEIEKKTHRFVRGRIAAIQQASDQRCEPGCPLFRHCGGCSWQHIDYAFQLEAKKNILHQNLLRIGGIDIEPADTVPSPAEYGYRGRLRMRVLPNGSLAFHAAAGGDLVEVESCPLAVEALNDLLRRVREGEISLPADSTVLFQMIDGKAKWEVEARKSGRDSRRRGRGKPGNPEKTGRSAGAAALGGAAEAEESGIGFHQVNEEVNHQVRQKVFGIAEQLRGDRGAESFRVLDLYCGNGNLSLSLTEAGAHVAGYDTNGASLEEARKNFRRNSGEEGGGQLFLKKIDALAAVREVASGRVRPFGTHRPDLVILDPPRGGVGAEGMKAICELQAGTILYVSCDPATLARDLKEAVEQGYHVEEAIPFDMFPQTSHFESLAVLKR